MQDCIEWNGCKNDKGYGQVCINGKKLYVHRLVYEQEFGEIPEGYYVMHRCDNPPCTNPAHLRIGTPKDNSEDMVKKQRQTYGEKNPRAKLTSQDVIEIHKLRDEGYSHERLSEMFGVGVPHMRSIVNGTYWKVLGAHSIQRKIPNCGTNHPLAKLTEEDVIWIRQMAFDGSISFNALGVMFSVDASIISDVVNRRTWRHV